MRHHFLLLTLAVSFCAAFPATDRVVPEREEVDFVAYSTSASFIQAMAKSGGTEEDCRTFATTTIATTKESVESEQKTLDAVDKGAECAQEGQEMVTSTQGTLNKAQSDLDIKKGAAETALSAKETACTASVAFDVNLDTLTSKECFNYKQESTYTIADSACTSAKSDLNKADLAVRTANTAVADGQKANEDAVAQAAELMSSCHCRVQQEQAAAWKAASKATAAHAADWKQAYEVICALDQTSTCIVPTCPAVTQPTLANGVADENCSTDPVTCQANPDDLNDQVFSGLSFHGYTYTINVGTEVTQTSQSVSAGTYSSTDSASSPKTQSYTGGTYAPGCSSSLPGKKRVSTVSFYCGETTQITAITEAVPCDYRITFETPGCC